MRHPPTILIQATTLADAWSLAVQAVLKEGMKIKTQYGPTSKDLCSVIEINYPFEEVMLHPQFPTKGLHLGEYIKQWERDYDWIKQGFEYNYMDRLINSPKPRGICDAEVSQKQIVANKDATKAYYNCAPVSTNNFIDQLEVMRHILNKGISRRCQATTWIPARDLFVQEDQPCLQRLWARNLGNGCMELHVMWRSRDCFAAWNSNMIGLLTMVKKELVDPSGLKLVKVVDFCNSLHIYEADWEAAALVRNLPRNQMHRI